VKYGKTLVFKRSVISGHNRNNRSQPITLPIEKVLDIYSRYRGVTIARLRTHSPGVFSIFLSCRRSTGIERNVVDECPRVFEFFFVFCLERSIVAVQPYFWSFWAMLSSFPVVNRSNLSHVLSRLRYAGRRLLLLYYFGE
jgi:hypothetical protein